MATDAGLAETRQRLLSAALEVFAERGYRAATFKEICGRAGTNTAAINYHFRDKLHLYLAVIEQGLAELQRRSEILEADPATPPRQRLRQFIAAVFRRLLGRESPGALLRLMAGEMVEPTAGLEVILQRAFLPAFKHLCGIIAELSGRTPEDPVTKDCALSVFGQCIFFYHARPIISKVQYPKYDVPVIEHLIEHTIRFVEAGIRVAAGRKAVSPGSAQIEYAS
jgi:AcrR family transcriptional regulator